MPIPTFDEMRERLVPLWQNEEYQKDILWAGIFGSVARNRAREESDVDILIVLKEHERYEPIDIREDLAAACGREISFMYIWQGPDWAWGHVRLEALLSSRTIYGNRGDIEHLRRKALAYLDDGLARFSSITKAVKIIKSHVASVKTFEKPTFFRAFVHPTQQVVRQECVDALREVVNLLDIQPLYHPIRTMLVPQVFDHVEKVDALLDQVQPDVAVEEGLVWKNIWDCIQPYSGCVQRYTRTMWAFDTGCLVIGPNRIRHMLASKRLADQFEAGGPVDDSMYREISR